MWLLAGLVVCKCDLGSSFSVCLWGLFTVYRWEHTSAACGDVFTQVSSEQTSSSSSIKPEIDEKRNMKKT